eukprot:865605-Pyramimonas_sp.AAC.1
MASRSEPSSRRPLAPRRTRPPRPALREHVVARWHQQPPREGARHGQGGERQRCGRCWPSALPA